MIFGGLFFKLNCFFFSLFVVYLSIGIVSMDGEDDNLLQTLQSLKTHMSPTEKTEVIIVIALDRESQAGISQNIEKNFQNELDIGLIQVIHPTQEFLGRVNAKSTRWKPWSFTENFKKKTVDFSKRLIFLFEYCFRMSKNVLLLTGQARAVRPYFPVIKQQIDNFETLSLSSYEHNFGMNELPGLGRLYSAHLAADVAEFGAMFPDGHLPRQIIDMYTVLRRSIKISDQKREEVIFTFGKELRGGNLEIEFQTTCSFPVGHEMEKALYDKSGFAWVMTPKKDDNIVMVFIEPLQISRVRVVSGSPLLRDTMSDSVLMVCENNAETGICDDSKCTEVGDFRDPILDVKQLENSLTFPVKCLKIVFIGEVKHWIIIREISIWPKA